MPQQEVAARGPKKLQVVFQGGGAKLCDLIAAAHALRDLEEETPPLIEVTRLAGTSAGAIAACLFATNMPMDAVRDRLRNRGPKIVERFAPSRTLLGMAWRLARGKPLYDESALREFLQELFTYGDRRFDRLEHLTREVLITASDIHVGEKITYRDPKDYLIRAMLDSCAIPFAFRTASHGGTVVDGGLCENLPSEELVAERTTYGDVVAFSFDKIPGGEPPRTILDYAMALCNTAIDNSIARATRQVGENLVYRIQTDIGTFEFSRAVTEGLADDHYKRVRLECRDWLRGILSRPSSDEPGVEVAVVTPAADPIPPHEVTDRIYAVHLRQRRPDSLRLSRCALIATANCLLPDTDPRSGYPDEVVQMVEIHPQNQPLQSFSQGLTSGGASPVQGATAWRLLDSAGNPHEHTAIPLHRTDESGVIWNEVVFFFHPPLEPGGQAPYRLEQSNHQSDSLIGLSRNGSDWMRYRSEQSSLVESFDIVVYLPIAYQDVSVSDLPAELHVAGKGSVMPWVAGRSMTPPELAKYAIPPAGFVVKGWRASNVPHRHCMGALLTRLKRS